MLSTWAWGVRPVVAAAAAAAAACFTIWALLALRRQDAATAELVRAASARAERAEAAQLQLREALDELPSGLEIYDGEDRLLFYNKRIAELYPWIDWRGHVGSAFEKIIRELVGAGRVPAAIGREEQWISERLATRGSRTGPILQSLKSGTWINTYEKRTASNYVVGVRLEVTDLVQRTRELGETTERLRAVIGSAAAGIVSTDVNGVVLEANPAALAMFGGTSEWMVGRQLSSLIPRLELMPDGALGAGPGVLGLARRAELDGRTADGRVLRLNASIAEISAAGSTQFVVILSNETERVQAEQARRALETQLRESQKIESIGTLAAGIAHDFNNVLGSIIGLTKLAHDDIDSGEIDRAQDSLLLVGRAADRARKL